MSVIIQPTQDNFLIADPADYGEIQKKKSLRKRVSKGPVKSDRRMSKKSKTVAKPTNLPEVKEDEGELKSEHDDSQKNRVGSPVLDLPLYQPQPEIVPAAPINNTITKMEIELDNLVKVEANTRGDIGEIPGFVQTVNPIDAGPPQ